MARPITLNPKIISRVQAYKQALTDARIGVQKVIVFGSQAKGSASADSDIDVAVISPQFGKDYFDESVRLMHFRTTDNLNIEPHPFHPDDFNDHWDSLASEVKKYGIEV